MLEDIIDKQVFCSYIVRYTLYEQNICYML